MSLHHQAGDVGRGGGWVPSRGGSREQTRVRALHGGVVPAQMGVYPAGKHKGTGPTGETLLGCKGQHWRQPPPPPSLRHQPSRMRAVGLEASPRPRCQHSGQTREKCTSSAPILSEPPRGCGMLASVGSEQGLLGVLTHVLMCGKQAPIPVLLGMDTRLLGRTSPELSARSGRCP